MKMVFNHEGFRPRTIVGDNYFMEDSRIYRTKDGNWHLLCHALALRGDRDECSANRCAPHAAAHDSKPTSRERDLVHRRGGRGQWQQPKGEHFKGSRQDSKIQDCQHEKKIYNSRKTKQAKEF